MEQPDGSGDQPEIVFGLHTLREILRANTRPLLRIHVIRPDRQFSDLVRLARNSGIPVHIDPPARLERLVPHGRHQGIVGLVGAKAYTEEQDLLEQVVRNTTPALLVVFDSIQDPQNLGAVLRTADAAGVNGVFIPGRRSVGLTAGVAKASAGAIEYVQVAQSRNTSRLIEKLKNNGVRTYALDPTASTLYTDLDLREPVALVFGSEGGGIRPGVKKKCDKVVSIPMIGQIESLNLSVTVGIVLFEAVRQRKENK
jgi:23S rRNA (guanosine2251-2'-O)-methyltransferase